MKKTFQIIAVVVLFFCSTCQESNLEGLQTDETLIKNAKEFFEYSATKQASHAAPGSIAGLSKTPLWKKASIQTLTIGKAVVVPLHFNDAALIKINTVGDKLFFMDNLAKLLIYRDEEQAYHAEVVIQFPGKRDGRSVYGEIVAAEDWSGHLLGGYQYENGIIKKLRPVENGEGITARMQAIEICYTYYGHNSSADDPKGFDWSYTVCNYYYYDDGSGGNNGPTGDDYGNVGGGGNNTGGGDGTPCGGSAPGRISPCDDPEPEPAPESIINNVKTPCLKAMVNSFKNSSSLMTYLFGSNPDFDMIYEEADLGIGLEHDQANTKQGGNGTTYFKITTTLNSRTLPGASREYTMATLIHEMHHAFMIIFYPNQSDNEESHEFMADSTIINEMAQMLRQFCPSLDMQTAIDLSWGGLEKTTAFSKLPSADQSRILRTNTDFKRGAQGTSCEDWM